MNFIDREALPTAPGRLTQQEVRVIRRTFVFSNQKYQFKQYNMKLHRWPRDPNIFFWGALLGNERATKILF